ncbi:TetR/AcrR family transcriptional regulator [Nocardia sp. CA2R105]|uniref:TetR/AcrR family transcriptional regulator n=1 Tax=Nocardia coffeae TaxID=2873381 RepID=UPI001CA791CF|nr:TetR/AcrR family transcriptional regulator [Nocardia coffeae]MBY8862921.1 TetR/AcrR family transcriptional regulator [Nocardia coffeae]
MSDLQESKRQATVEHLVRAATRALVDRGLDATVDDVAQHAGVSRRTVFRYFATRDDLLAAAILAGLPAFDANLPQHDRETDWRAWVSALCDVIHGMNSEVSRMLWDLMTRHDKSEVLAAAAEEIDSYRRKRNDNVAVTLWRALGCTGSPAAGLLHTVNAHLSPFFTMAVIRDANGDRALAAELAESAIVDAAERYRTQHAAMG